VLAAVAAMAQPAPSPVKVSRLSAPEKALKFEVLVPARIDDVWKAFTTAEGLNTWLWQDCTVDLRPGGGWTVHYPGGKTGGGTIVSLKEGRQIVIRALAPEQFPEVRRIGTLAIFDFAPAGTETRVTLTQKDWKEGKEWDDAYEYLAKGNAQLLNQLYLRFSRGPLKWK
jgi:uncharacterized protein YndB with AHSA1/START domain